jgi:hypothetical protein
MRLLFSKFLLHILFLDVYKYFYCVPFTAIFTGSLKIIVMFNSSHTIFTRWNTSVNCRGGKLSLQFLFSICLFFLQKLPLKLRILKKTLILQCWTVNSVHINVYWRSAIYMGLMHKYTFICVRTFSIVVPFLCPLTVIFLKCSTYLKPNSVLIVLHFLFSRHYPLSNVRNRKHYFAKQKWFLP